MLTVDAMMFRDGGGVVRIKNIRIRIRKYLIPYSSLSLHTP